MRWTEMFNRKQPAGSNVVNMEIDVQMLSVMRHGYEILSMLSECQKAAPVY